MLFIIFCFVRNIGNRDACGPLKKTLDPGPNFRVGGVSRGGGRGGHFGGWEGGSGGGVGGGSKKATNPGSVGVREVGRNPDPEIDGPSIEHLILRHRKKILDASRFFFINLFYKFLFLSLIKNILSV